MDPQTIIAQRIARELRDGMLVNLGMERDCDRQARS
jgi:acyl CoA:acetate/3-ketoacid CoA transferase beta subunit